MGITDKNRIQEWFNIAYEGLSSQNWVKCMATDGWCRYSNEKGQHCAWGWVDKDTWHLMGSVGALANSPKATPLLKSMTEEEIKFAMDLQAAHDMSTSSASMEDNMRRLAILHNLTVPKKKYFSDECQQ